jgi:hypothetical protein
LDEGYLKRLCGNDNTDRRRATLVQAVPRWLNLGLMCSI